MFKELGDFIDDITQSHKTNDKDDLSDNDNNNDKGGNDGCITGLMKTGSKIRIQKARFDSRIPIKIISLDCDDKKEIDVREESL